MTLTAALYYNIQDFHYHLGYLLLPLLF
jgi:hypothetical protein